MNFLKQLNAVWCVPVMLLCMQAAQAQNLRNEWIDYSKTYYKFKLKRWWMHRKEYVRCRVVQYRMAKKLADRAS